MSEAHTKARKSYWSNLPQEEKSKRMREIARKRQKGMTFKQKRDHALKMVQARRTKAAARISTPAVV